MLIANRLSEMLLLAVVQSRQSALRFCAKELRGAFWPSSMVWKWMWIWKGKWRGGRLSRLLWADRFAWRAQRKQARPFGKLFIKLIVAPP